MILPQVPFRVEIEVTGMCNLACPNCYAQPLSHYEPPLVDVIYMLQKTKQEVDPFEVILCGGEPFTRKDVLDVIEELRNLFGRRVGVVTNGTAFDIMTEADFARLKKIAGDDAFIQISADSAKPSLNNMLRGKTDTVFRGMQKMDDHQIPFSIGTVVSKENINDIMDTEVAFMSEFKHLHGINLNRMMPNLSNKERYHESLDIGAKEMAALIVQVRGTAARMGSSVRITGTGDKCACNDPAVLDTYKMDTCLAGVFRATVFPNGNVSPCALMRDANIGNVFKESWHDIWVRSLERYETLPKGMQCRSKASA